MSNLDYFFAPLRDFPWDGRIQIDSNWSIEKIPNKWLEELLSSSLISKEDERTLGQATHALVGRGISGANANINLFLLALWIVRPTKTRADFSFFRKGLSTSPSRYMDKFQPNPASISEELQDSDIDLAAKFFLFFQHEAFGCPGRLRTALQFSIFANFSIAWQVSFICHASSTETLLNCFNSPGITRQLAEAFSLICANNGGSRQDEFRQFYDRRSDIVHGKGYLPNNPDENLNLLNQATCISRDLWQKVYSEQAYFEALKNDSLKPYFDSLKSRPTSSVPASRSTS